MAEMMGGGVDKLEELWEILRLTEESLKIKRNGVEEKMKDKGDKSLVGKVFLD